jgi:hypothetical protein
MRQYTGKETNTALAKNLLHALYHVGMAQNGGATDEHGGGYLKPIKRLAEVGESIDSAHDVLLHRTVPEGQGGLEIHAGVLNNQ